MKVPDPDEFDQEDLNILNNFINNYENIIKYINTQNINSYMDFIVDQMFLSNKYFNDQEPWKKKNNTKRLNTIIYTSMELIRKITILLYPVIPQSSLKALSVFNINEKDISFKTIKNNIFLKPNMSINKIDILFNKINKDD